MRRRDRKTDKNRVRARPPRVKTQRVKTQRVKTQAPQLPPRLAFPDVQIGPPEPVRAGEILYTTRPGCERDLIEEITFQDRKAEPRLAGPSLVAAVALPRRHGHPIELAFARQGFRVSEVVAPAQVGPALGRALAAASRQPLTWSFDLWVPDSDETNPRSQEAQRLEQSALTAIPTAWSEKRVPDARGALAENGIGAQGCHMPDGRVAIGAPFARELPSLAPGGRMRVHVPEAAPSRAAMKLVEALTWLDRSPEPGDLCVDLGAAPGGWTWVLLERRTRVIAVDPANLAPSVRDRKGLLHARGDAFRFAPDEPVDWLFCDMAFRPLEVAALLGKWARKKLARLLVANIKLPMRKKAEHLLRVREILQLGGWEHIRVRQLYHDRDEVTFAAVRIR
jgi:23S rRNA (cytidine2498-2'-O)-methyltransferase